MSVVATISDIWNYFGPFKGPAGSILLTVIGALIVQSLRPKVKIIWGRASVSYNSLPLSKEDIEANRLPTKIYTETTYLQNTGKLPGSDVEIVVEGMPNTVSFYPEQNFEVGGIGDGNTVIRIKYIAPKELLVMTHLSINGSALSVESVRSKEASGKNVDFWITRNFGQLFNLTVYLFLLLGIAYVVDIIGLILR